MSQPVVLFQSPFSDGRLQSGLHNEQVVVRQVVWSLVEGEPQIAVNFRGGISPMVLSTDILGDPIIGYRTALLLEAVPKLGDESIQRMLGMACCLFAEDAKWPPPLGMADKAASVIGTLNDLVGSEKLAAIRTAIPPNLEEVLALTREHGEQKIGSLCALVDEGLMTLTPFLRSMGVEKKDVLEARRNRLMDQADKFRPIFREFLRTVPQHCLQVYVDGKIGEQEIPKVLARQLMPNTDVDALINVAIECLERGVTEFHEVVAFALVRRLHDAYVSMDQYTKAFPNATKSGDFPSTDPEAIFGKIGPWVAMKTSQKPQDVLTDLRSLWKKWKTMPIVAT